MAPRSLDYMPNCTSILPAAQHHVAHPSMGLAPHQEFAWRGTQSTSMFAVSTHAVASSTHVKGRFRNKLCMLSTLFDCRLNERYHRTGADIVATTQPMPSSRSARSRRRMHFPTEGPQEVYTALSPSESYLMIVADIDARIGGFDILWSVNKLARAVTKWTRACGKRLARLISYIHHTKTIDNIVMWVIQFNIADWVYIKSESLLETLRTPNQSREKPMYLWKSNICSHKLDVQAETSVSHSSTESEI